MYAESVIPRTILNEDTTAYIIELCILPSLESDNYQQFLEREDLDNDQDIEYLGEDWIKFRNYAIINSDQVTYLNMIMIFIYILIFQGFVAKLVERTNTKNCNDVTAHQNGNFHENYNVRSPYFPLCNFSFIGQRTHEHKAPGFGV